MIKFISFNQILANSNAVPMRRSLIEAISVQSLKHSLIKSRTIAQPILHPSIPMIVGDNPSINRIYEMSKELSGRSGMLICRYEEGVLSRVTKAGVVLEILDPDRLWISIQPILDEINNTLTYDFTDFMGFPSFSTSDEPSTLTVKPMTLNNDVRVYPNPTTDHLFVVTNTPQKATLYDETGQKILDSDNAKSLEVKDLSLGIYSLNLCNSKNQISTFKITKK